MMYFSKEELELIRDMLVELYPSVESDNLIADELHPKIINQLETME